MNFLYSRIFVDTRGLINLKLFFSPIQDGLFWAHGWGGGGGGGGTKRPPS